jgi:hypothetical protein
MNLNQINVGAMGMFTPPIAEFSSPEFPDHEQTIARMVHPPLIANDIDTSTKEGEEQLQSILYTRYQGDTISPVPMCSCGRLSGGVNHGLLCPVCATECKNQLERPIETTLWIKSLDPKLPFICPGPWLVMSSEMTFRGWNLLEYLVNPDYPDPTVENRFYTIVGNIGFPQNTRNLQFFHDNFEGIMYRILVQMVLKKKPRDVPGLTNEQIVDLYRGLREGQIDAFHILLNTSIGKKLEKEKEFAAFVRKYSAQKTRIFSRYLPMPSSAGIVLETNSSGTWYDKVMLIAVDAMYAITNFDRSIQERSFKMRNNKMLYCIKKMAEYSSEFIRERVMGKKGVMRAHYFGGRQPFSMRCVIGPIIGPHENDELHLPWAPSVQTFRLHITNKLLRRRNHPEFGNWTPKNINKFIDAYTNRYHPLLDEIFQELIAESKNGKGIKVLFNRPPSLEKGSVQCCRVTKIKTDAVIKTISMSTNITQAPNADFDGDQMAIYVLLDNKLIGIFEPLVPSRNVPSTNAPHSISGATKQQAPQTLTMYNWLYGGHDKYNTVDN